MRRLFVLMFVGIAMLSAPGIRGDAPQPPEALKAAMPAGKWKVEFSNGVTEMVTIGNGGHTHLVEPAWNSVGMAEVNGGSVVITYGQDRVERWTRVGGRCVVEHWFPASRLPTVAPVLGIAELVE